MRESELIREIEEQGSELTDYLPYQLKKWREGLWLALPSAAELPLVGISGRFYSNPALTAPNRRRWRLFSPRLIEIDGELVCNPEYEATKLLLREAFAIDDRDESELPHTLREAFDELCARISV